MRGKSEPVTRGQILARAAPQALTGLRYSRGLFQTRICLPPNDTPTMNDTAPTALPADPLAVLAAPDDQRQAARTVQETFARVFRLAAGAVDDPTAELQRIETALRHWLETAPDADRRALRLAFLLAGLDQWGLAYTQAFGLVGIPALTELLGALRNNLDAQAEARTAAHFAALDQECAGQHFKVELRRYLHLALWHAMIASEDRADAQRVLNQLGGMLAALVRSMPVLGWRLVADTLAHIQIQCLAKGLATQGLGQETTQGLFAALRQTLAREDHERILAYATQALLDWQQAQRPGN